MRLKQQTIILSLFIAIMMIATTIHAEIPNIEYTYGIYAIDLFKMILGIISIIGAFGLLVTSSPRNAHWPEHIRRTFFGIFVFCTIINQAFFNVINVPNNKNLVCMLGSCYKKISNNIIQ